MHLTRQFAFKLAKKIIWGDQETLPFASVIAPSRGWLPLQSGLSWLQMLIRNRSTNKQALGGNRDGRQFPGDWEMHAVAYPPTWGKERQ